MHTTHYLMADVDFWPSVELRESVEAQIDGWGERKRALVRAHFGRMVWAYESGAGDVFDRVLQLAAEYARGVDSTLHGGERVSECCQHTEAGTRS